MLIAEQLSLQLDGNTILTQIDLEVRGGDFFALLGANGAGKSSLLSLLARERPLQKGRLQLNQRHLADYSSRQLARVRAVLPQSLSLFFPFTAAEVVRMGRLPWQESHRQSQSVLAHVMRLAEIDHLADRPYPLLSGGEKQRVQLARVLAQLWPFQPGQLLLLDECTASLDPLHQQQVFALARALADQGMMVVAVVHDLQLAAQYASRLALMSQGRMLAQGPSEQVLTPEGLHQAYHGLQVRIQPHADGLLVVPKTLTVQL